MPQLETIPTPRHFYILASTPRVGSELLCDVLHDTGIAGYPGEFYSPVIRAKWLHFWSLTPDCSPEAFLQASLALHTTPNGWHGVKIHSYQVTRGLFPRLARGRGVDPWAALEVLYPGARYIWLRREDLRAQALSFFRAQRTGAWCRERPGFEPVIPFVREETPPVLDPAQVLIYETRLQADDAAWEAYFLRRQLTPLVLTYEALWKDVQWETARVLDFLGLPTDPAYATVSPRLMKQADAITDAWRRRMEKDGNAYPRPQLRK